MTNSKIPKVLPDKLTLLKCTVFRIKLSNGQLQTDKYLDRLAAEYYASAYPGATVVPITNCYTDGVNFYSVIPAIVNTRTVAPEKIAEEIARKITPDELEFLLKHYKK